ncbi:MAG: transglutaminase domain-containing protein [Chloroflexi bacterium]|nr:transglutaminase domain-containing protein [Chloroflexota bacterium]MBU1661420.1 transglutaminase domain-containing protein [Chloroflexota bacterium]
MPPQLPPPSRSRWWDWLAAILLLVAMQSVAARLTATDWVNDLQITLALALLGGIAGLALGVSRFSPAKVTFFAFVYGLAIVPWQLGLILGRGILWLERMTSLWGRYEIAFGRLAGQQDVTDPLLFLSIVAILTWGMSLYAGYALVRQGSPWLAVLPGGVAIMVINAYSYQDELNARFLGFYIFVALFLVARLYFLDRHAQWQKNHIPLPFHIGFDLIVGTVVTAGLLVIMAWNVPAIAEALTPAEQSWQRAMTPWHSMSEYLGNAFAALRSSVGLVPVGGIRGYYGDELPMGRGVPLGDDLVLSIEAPPLPSTGMRYYWRARHYDHYEDGLWSNTRTKTEFATPDQFELVFPVYEAQWDAAVKITTHISLSTLYAPSQLRWVSRPVELETIPAPDNTIDIAAMHATPPLMAGEVYEVQASLHDVTITELRAAGTDYPDWITKKYLQLPASITPRTLALAGQIAAGKDNPYDQIAAITAYLRTHISYVERLPELPRTQEPLDWMLFDLQQGFCNYYASAEVVLARSLGIPARLAAGYTQGELLLDAVGRPALGGNVDADPGDFVERANSRQIFRVLAKNAHSWPEIFFPGIGWVEFEPSVNQNALLRPLEEDAANRAADSQSDRDDEADPYPESGQFPEDEFAPPEELPPAGESHGESASRWVSFCLILGVILLFWKYLRRFRNFPPMPVLIEMRLLRINIRSPSGLRRWARWSGLSALQRAFHEINRALTRLGHSPAQADTPSERAAALSLQLPDISETVQTLLAEYQNAIYGAQLANVKMARSLARKIRAYSYKVRLRRLFGKGL